MNLVTLGHLLASFLASPVVTLRQLLSPNPSASASVIFFDPHQDGAPATGFSAAAVLPPAPPRPPPGRGPRCSSRRLHRRRRRRRRTPARRRRSRIRSSLYSSCELASPRDWLTTALPLARHSRTR